MKEAPVEETWNKKRIFIAILALIVILCFSIFSYKRMVLDNNQAFPKKSIQELSVKGVSSQAEKQAVNITKDFESKLTDIKKEVGKIDIVEIASSSPQVQKVINDLKALQNYPKDQAKDMCEKICNSF